MNQTFGTNVRISETIEKYSDMIRRICFLYLKNKTDVEDAFQEIFLKFILQYKSFKSEDHEKAWLCKVAFNQCKDMQKSIWRKRVDSLEKLDIPFESQEQSDLIEAILSLPADMKQIIYLHYYERMTVPEIAALMNKNNNTVYTDLRSAKIKLKDKLKEDN